MTMRRNHRLWRRVAAGLMAGLLTAAMLVGTAVPVRAEETPQGTLTIVPKDGDKELSADNYSGTFKVYKVASYDPNGTFTKDAQFKEFTSNGLEGDTFTGDVMTQADGGDQRFRELTDALAAFVKDSGNDVQPMEGMTGIKAGQTVTLPYGLYLVMQDRKPSNYEEAGPILAMIPQYTYNAETGERGTNTTVIAYPKVSPKRTPPDEPPGGGGDDNPPGTPPVTPPEEIEEVGEEITPEQPGEIEESGSLLTGDDSMMTLYGAMVMAAGAGLAAWALWRRRRA